MKCQAGWSTSWNQDRWEKHGYLRYADDTTLWAKGKEELKSLLMRVKEESKKADLKLNIIKLKSCIRSHHFIPFMADASLLVFWMLSFKPAFSLSSCTYIIRLFSSSLLSAIQVVSSAYLKLLIFPPAILIPAGASSSPAFRMMYTAYKLNKQGKYSLDILLSQFGTSLFHVQF